MTPRAWLLWLTQALIGWFVAADRLLYQLHPGATLTISFGLFFLVLAVALSYLLVRERFVLFVLLWDAGFRGALAKAERNAVQDDADLLYTQGLEAQLAAGRIREQEKDALIEQQADELKVLRGLAGRRKEDRGS